MHVQSFLHGGNKPKRVKSRRGRDTDTDNDYSDNDRRSRATTPGRALLEEVNLKPASERTIKNRLDPPPKEDEKSELKNHFRDFMRTPATVKRGRSFSQPRDKDGKNSGKEETSLSRKESFNDKYTREADHSKIELENHAKRFLQRRSLIKPHRHSDNDSDNDSLSASFNTGSNKTVDKDCRDSSSEDELENSSSASNNNLVSYKPPLKSAPINKTETHDANNNSSYDNLSQMTADRSTISKKDDGGSIHHKHQNNVSTRSNDRVRSKSEIVPPTNYDVELNVEQMLEESWGPRSNSNGNVDTVKRNNIEENNTSDLEDFTGQAEDWTEKEKDENNFLNNAIISTSEQGQQQRIRKYNVYSNSEYVYLDVNMKIGNSKPRPFTLSHHSSQDNDKKSYSRQNSSEYSESKYLPRGSCDTDCGNVSNKTNSLHSTEQLEKSYSKMYLGEDKENRKHSREKFQRSDHRRSESKHDDADDVTHSHNIASSFTAKTTEILNACKNDIKKLTYRKIYMRSRSDHDRGKAKSVEKEQDNVENGVRNGTESPNNVYTKYSSGSKIPNRPTTPGPYLERAAAAISNTSPYIPQRPTTPGPFTRESWKRTNKKFNYTHLNKYSSHETFV